MTINNLFKIIQEFNRNFCQPEKIGTLIFTLNTWFNYSSFRPKLTFSMSSFSFSTIDFRINKTFGPDLAS